jgi:hypothetical protein
LEKGVKYIVVELIFLCFSLNGAAQGWLVEENTIETNWNVTLQAGRSALISEMKKDFSSARNDMNNTSSWSVNLQLAKMVFERFDVGFEFGLSQLKGYKDNPRNVNLLMRHPDYNNELAHFAPFPIYYNTDLISYSPFIKYNFINFSSFSKGFFNLNIYTRLGLGVTFVATDMGYQDVGHYPITGLSHPLYLKGRYPSPVRDAHGFVSLAGGLNYQLSGRWFVSVEGNFQLQNADYLDGVHNYDSELTPQTPITQIEQHRIQVFDIVGRFMFGATYFFNFDSKRHLREYYLPWYANRYRSYYSKYQTRVTKKDRQDRLPFYNDKMK